MPLKPLAGFVVTTGLVLCLFFAVPALAKDSGISIPTILKKGTELYDSGRYKDALKLYLEALRFSPDNGVLNYEAALTYYALGDYDNALGHAEKAASTIPGEPNPHILLGAVYNMLNNPEKALGSYRSAIKTQPRNPMAHFNLAIHYYNIQRYTDAETAIKKAVELSPEHASGHYTAGCTYVKLNNPEKAESHFRKFMTIETKGKRFESVSELLRTHFKSK